EREQVVHLTNLALIEVIEPRDDVVAAAGQTRIGGRCDAEGVEIRGADGEVVHRREIVVPAAEVADADRYSQEELVLDAGRELPVGAALPPAVQNVWIDRGAHCGRTKIQI